MGQHLTCAFPSGRCCYTWRPSCLVWLGQVRGWGQGAVSHGHSLQPGLIWHKQGSRALHRAPLSASMGSLSSAGNSHHLPRRSVGVGGRGRKVVLAQSPDWPQRQSSPFPFPLLPTHTLWPDPLSGHLSPRVFTDLASQVPFHSHRAFCLWCPRCSICLGFCLPPSAYWSSFSAIWIRRFCQDSPTTSHPRTTAPQESDQCQHLRDLTWQLSGPLAGDHIEVNFGDPYRDPATAVEIASCHGDTSGTVPASGLIRQHSGSCLQDTLLPCGQLGILPALALRLAGL